VLIRLLIKDSVTNQTFLNILKYFDIVSKYNTNKLSVGHAENFLYNDSSDLMQYNDDVSHNHGGLGR